MFDRAKTNVNRRHFLKAAAACAAGIVTLSPREVLAKDSKEPAHWALLSDTHISFDPRNKYRGFCPYQNLKEITGQLHADLPDGLVVTGDLARLKGHEGDYVNLRKLLSPLAEKRPIHLATGNHDDRTNFLRTFRDAEDRDWRVGSKRIVTVNGGPVRFIILDSLLFVDLPWGKLGARQLAWLNTYLKTTEEIPTILFLHHTITDGDLLDAREFIELIRPVSCVKAIVHGHSHEFGFTQMDGIHVINLPATAYNHYRSGPVGWVQAQLTDRQGEFTLRAVEGNTRLDGHTERLRWRT